MNQNLIDALTVLGAFIAGIVIVGLAAYAVDPDQTFVCFTVTFFASAALVPMSDLKVVKAGWSLSCFSSFLVLLLTAAVSSM